MLREDSTDAVESVERADVESTWVRSVYLYVMCALSIVLVAAGAITTVVASASAISPSLGHRDVLDRAGIGIAHVAEDVINIVRGQNAEDTAAIRDYCEEFYSEDVDGCISDNSLSGQLDPIVKGVEAVRTELEDQIRNSAIARIIRGLAFVITGLLLWRIHARRTDLFRDGVLRPKPAAATDSV